MSSIIHEEFFVLDPAHTGGYFTIGLGRALGRPHCYIKPRVTGMDCRVYDTVLAAVVWSDPAMGTGQSGGVQLVLGDNEVIQWKNPGAGDQRGVMTWSTKPLAIDKGV